MLEKGNHLRQSNYPGGTIWGEKVQNCFAFRKGNSKGRSSQRFKPESQGERDAERKSVASIDKEGGKKKFEGRDSLLSPTKVASCRIEKGS